MSGQAKAIQDQFERLEKKKQVLFLLISSLTPEIYSQQPSASSWSVGQAANHIYLSERLSFAYLRKKLSYPETIPTYHPKSWGGILLIKAVFFTHFK